MISLRALVRSAVVIVALVGVNACGGGDSTQPGSGSSSGNSKGTLTAVIDGVAYTGIVNTAKNVNGILDVASNNSALTVSVNFATSASVGTTAIAGSATAMNVITTNGTTVLGSWTAATIQGSGSITITSLTSSGASGTFNFNAPPAPPPSNVGATGTKVVTSGVFNVTF